MANKRSEVNERGEKLCTGCGDWLPLSEFHRQSSRPCGVKSRCKKCGCSQALSYYYKHPEKNVESQRRYRKRHRDKINQARKSRRNNHPERAILFFASRRAKASGLPFNIDLSDVQVPEFCPVFGIRLVSGGCRRQHDASPTIDRIIPKLGYVKGNVRVISWRANRIKSDSSVDEMRALVRYMESVAVTAAETEPAA